MLSSHWCFMAAITCRDEGAEVAIVVVPSWQGLRWQFSVVGLCQSVRSSAADRSGTLEVPPERLRPLVCLWRHSGALFVSWIILDHIAIIFSFHCLLGISFAFASYLIICCVSVGEYFIWIFWICEASSQNLVQRQLFICAENSDWRCAGLCVTPLSGEMTQFVYLSISYLLERLHA